MSEINRKTLELGHFERISNRCKYQYKNEKGKTYLTQYVLSGEDKLSLFINKDTGTYTEIIKRNGQFSDFPGIEYCDELLHNFEYSKIETYVKYGAYIVKIDDNKYLFQWIVQPHISDPGDEWGYGMEEQPEIRLYSHIDGQGSFTEPFKLYSICDRGYYEDPDEAIKVIFLDFDGVLNSRQYLVKNNNSGVAIDNTRLDLIRKIVFKTDAKIVLSTSWREHWNIIPWMCDETGKQINKLFDEFGLYIYDKTLSLEHNRYDEITDWLKEHPNIKNYVVIDDEPFEQGVLRDHFVLTSSFKNGLDEDDVEKAINILNI